MNRARPLELLPGLLLAIAVGAAGLALGERLPSLGGVAIAIFLGVIVGNVARPGARFSTGLAFAEKSVLAAAIVLLGARLEFAKLGSLGAGALLGVLVAMALAIGAGLLLARLFGFGRSMGWLLGVGSAVCGASAIAAVAPLVSRDREEVGVSVGVVNLLGTIGIALLPLAVAALGLDARQGALVVGGSLQAVGHVVAAGFAIGPETGELATAIKMGRVAMLGPIVILIGAFAAQRSEAQEAEKRFRLPGYLIGFALLALVANLGLVPREALAWTKPASNVLLAVAMAGIGLRIRLAAFAKLGARALVAGALICALQVAWLALAARLGAAGGA